MMVEESYLVNALALLGAVFLRWTVSLNLYSGAGKPPMFGDYEAQRHWMEITYNLPAKEWYFNSSKNDLMYWGLDYPPVTAYHSWLCGFMSHHINPKWVELASSRGFESHHHKLFMRYTVLVADLLIYVTAVFAFVHSCMSSTKITTKGLICGVILAYPGLILIDHGHFQYNCISLGLTLWSVVFLARKQEVLGAIFFTLALNYKQMELYHAFPFFFYLAGLCWKEKSWLRSFLKLACIGATVVGVFLICWLPFLGDVSSILQVVHRIFPVARGLYEDKVANFWCAVSVVIKIKNMISVPRTVQLCLVTTLAACIPSSVDLFFRPTIRKFLLSLINCSLAFFLFSFQVHEKSILIPALPVCLLLPAKPLECTWFLLISTFSMFPLLEKDGQALSYVALVALFLLLACQCFDFTKKHDTFKYLFLASIIGAVIIHLLAIAVKPPERLPDLFPVLFAVYSCGHFLLAFLYFNVIQIQDLAFDDERLLQNRTREKKTS
eukprot:Seg996.3 transcript_id=Seg996.3/GoldUCD/mRNA.D3Y31 product="Dolichyl pyrophosphate Man9GlcNAc2 alpha-1 3-glucosyltransferase" protein_id=Seg996.3/GoldUCD/D3Y31